MSRHIAVGGLVAVVVVLGATGTPYPSWVLNVSAQSEERPPVSAAQFERWKTELSNWGRWGPDDEMGALNLITPEKRRQAAALVRDGVTVSLSRDVTTEQAVDNPTPYEHAMPQTSHGVEVEVGTASDRLAVSYHGYAHTHVDGLAHRFYAGRMWNGFSYEEVTEAEGVKKNSIYNLRHGLVTRGVLMDIPRLKGVPYLEPGTRIYVEDLEAWEKQAGVTVSSGDAVFIRTGRWVRRAEAGPWNMSSGGAGLDASVIPWLRERDVALLGSESAMDATPPPEGSQIGALPLHDFALIMLGIHLVDNANLEAVAAVAAERSRWEFLLMAGTLPVRNGTGSPVNPIAVF